MKRMLLVAVLAGLTLRAIGQGTVLFSNDGVRMFVNDLPVGAGFTAQLDSVINGEPVTPLFPTTTFQTSQEGRGFVNPIVVTVPGLPPGSEAILQMVIFKGPSYDPTSPSCIGSTTGRAILGGGGMPPGQLTQLTSIDFECIPERSTVQLSIFACLTGFGFLLFPSSRQESQKNEL